MVTDFRIPRWGRAIERHSLCRTREVYGAASDEISFRMPISMFCTDLNLIAILQSVAVQGVAWVVAKSMSTFKT
jgi:hypothetical protein